MGIGRAETSPVVIFCNWRRSRLQVKKLKAQLEQKTRRTGTENGSGPDGGLLENGTDPNIIELQSKSPQAQQYIL